MHLKHKTLQTSKKYLWLSGCRERNRLIFLSEFSVFLKCYRPFVIISIILGYLLSTYLLAFDIRFFDHRSNIAIIFHIGDVVYLLDIVWRLIIEDIHIFGYKGRPSAFFWDDIFPKIGSFIGSLIRILSLVPIEYVAYLWKDDTSYEWLMTFAILRLNRLYRLKYLYYWAVRSVRMKLILMPGTVWKHIVWPLMSLLLIHALACVWYACNCDPVISNTKPPKCSKEWLQKYYDFTDEHGKKGHHPFYYHVKLDEPDPFGRYMGSILWSLMLIRQSGNYYSAPKNNMDILISNMLIFATFFAKFIIMLLAVNAAFQTRLTGFFLDSQIRSIRHFLRFMNLSDGVWIDMSKNILSVWNRRGFFTDNVFRFVYPTNLNQAIAYEKFSVLIHSSEFLQTLSRAALEALALSIERRTYFEGEFIIRPETVDNRMRFISLGFASIIEPERKARLINICHGTLIGEQNIVTPTYRKYGIQAVSDCETIELSWEAVNDILKVEYSARQKMHILLLRRLDFVSRRLSKNSKQEHLYHLIESNKLLSNPNGKTFSNYAMIDSNESYVKKPKYVTPFAYQRHMRKIIFNEEKFNEYDTSLIPKLERIHRNTASNAAYKFVAKVRFSSYNLGFPGWAISKDTNFYALWGVFVIMYTLFHSVWLVSSMIDEDNDWTVGAINVTTDFIFTIDAILMLFVFRQPFEMKSKAAIIDCTTKFVKEMKCRRAWFDIIAIFPWWYLFPYCKLSQRLRFHMLFKLGSVLCRVSEFENNVTCNTHGTRLLKYSTTIGTFIFLGGTAMAILRCEKAFKTCKLTQFDKETGQSYVVDGKMLSTFIYWAFCIFFGIGFNEIKSQLYETEFHCFMYLFGFLLLTKCYADLISIRLNISKTKSTYEKARLWMRKYFEWCYAPLPLMKKVDNLLVKQWVCWRGIESISRIEMDTEFVGVGHTIYEELIIEAILNTLCSLALFKHMDPGMVREFCLRAELRFVERSSIILQYGVVLRQMYIIRRGVVEIKICTGGDYPIVYKYGPGTCIGFGEMIFNLQPIIHVTSISDVELITFKASAFHDIFGKSSQYRILWKELLSNSHLKDLYLKTLAPEGFVKLVKGPGDEEKLEIVQRHPALHIFMKPSLSERRVNFKNRRWKIPWNMASSWIKLLRPCTLPVTINPMKSFEKIWMTFRLLSIIYIVYVVPIIETFPCKHQRVDTIFIHIYDTIAIIDMFLRFYTAYYDPAYNNHPAQTISNYLKTSFLTDLLASPAFYYSFKFVSKFASIEFRQSLIAYMFRLNRVLMSYHFFGYFQETNKYSGSPNYLTRLLKLVSIFFICGHIIACVLAMLACPAYACPYPFPRCLNKSWVTVSLAKQKLPHFAENYHFPRDNEIYHAAFYFVTTTATGCSFGDFTAVTTQERYFMAFTLFFYTLVTAYIISRVIAVKSISDFSLNNFQNEVRVLMEFMVQAEVDYHLKQSILSYYEHQWHLLEGGVPSEYFSLMHPALRMEIGMTLHSETFKRTEELDTASWGFLRGLCEIAQLQFLPMNQIVFKEYDVCEELYLIKSGSVLCSKHAYIGTRVKRIGFLGTLECFHDYTALVIESLELLVFSKKDFELLSKTFPQDVKNIKEGMEKDRKKPYSMNSRHGKLRDRTRSDALPLRNPEEKLLDMTPGHNRKFFGQYEKYLDPAYDDPLCMAVQRTNDFNQKFEEIDPAYYDIYEGFVINRSGILYKLLNFLYLIGALISCIVVPYQIGFKNFAYYIWIVSYFGDVFYITKMIVSFFVSAVNSDGKVLSDRGAIASSYYGDFNGFTYDLLTIFPFEILALPQLEWIYPWDLASFLRINRLLRIKHVWEYFDPWVYHAGYNVKLRKWRSVRLLVLTGFYLHWVTCSLQFWTFTSCPNIKRPNYTQCLVDLRSTSWMGTKYDLKSSFIEQPYICAFYFVISAFSGITYGDVRAVTDFEMLFTSFLSISSKAWLAIGLADLVDGHIHIDGKANYSVAIGESLLNYKYEGVSDHTLVRTANHLQNVWNFNRGVIVPKYVATLPIGLKTELMHSLYQEHFMQSYLFYDLPNNFCRALAIKLKVLMVTCGDHILKSGEFGDRMYMINKGTVIYRKTLLQTDDCGNPKINEGRVSYPRHFGEENAFYGMRPYHCSYIAETDVELVFIDTKTLEKVFSPCFEDIRKIVLARFFRAQRNLLKRTKASNPKKSKRKNPPSKNPII